MSFWQGIVQCMSSARKEIEKLVALADIRIGGSRPFDIDIHDERFYDRVLSGGSIALGESYMDGWWDSPAIDQLVTKLLLAKLGEKVQPTLQLVSTFLKAKLLNLQSPTRAFEVGEVHYDLGNDLYRAMLDTRMVYTCGYWSGTPAATTLDEAQEAKLDLVCRKIGLKPGQLVWDIGCGWGAFMGFAAEKYGARCVGVTV